MPGPHGGLVRGAFVIRHIVGNEVHVAPVLDPQRAALALVESDRLEHQIAIGDPAAGLYLLFPPSVQQITGPRCAPETRSDYRGFPLDERFGLLVAAVVNNGEVEPQSKIHVTW